MLRGAGGVVDGRRGIFEFVGHGREWMVLLKVLLGGTNCISKHFNVF